MITYTFTIPAEPHTPNPGLAYWERVDYSKENDSEIFPIIAHKDISAKTIQRILQTMEFSLSSYNVCQHKLAQIEDIFDFLNRTANQRQGSYGRIVSHDIIDDIFISKRNQLNTYIQKNYNLDIKDMTETHIEEILGL
jgi:hypothetical protein